MNLIARIFNSTLGKKYIMAITGFLLFGFVIVHLLGNLQVFVGSPTPINEYAHFLKAKPGILWGARLGLLAIAILHVVTAYQLVARNRAARPVKYGSGKAPVAASLSSRTTAISGTIVLVFIIFHLLHFTVGIVDSSLMALEINGMHNVFGMMAQAFSNPFIAGFYLLSMALLCMHLAHGVGSMFQSLGIKNGAYDSVINRLAKVAAIIIFLGNSAIVIAFLTRAIK
ncbi:MAG: succinate dehydrogenase cytochrome b subunit [Blastocatellia bacterium]